MIVHQFTDKEALRIAAEIERKGERFYRMAQGVAGQGAVYNLLEMLRQQEYAHAARFEGMLQKITDKDDDMNVEYSMETNAFLSAIAAEVVFPGGILASLMNRELKTVRDVLLYAISSEKDSILFYMEMLLETKQDEWKQVLQEIIKEEKEHLYDLQRLLENTK